MFADNYDRCRFDERYPSLVIDIATIFTDRAGTRKRRLMPILALQTNAGILIPEEIIRWMMSEVTYKRLKALHASVAAVGRLWAFYTATGSPLMETAADVDSLIDSYLLMRVSPPENPEHRVFPLWDPVSADTAARDLRAIGALARNIRVGPSPATPLGLALKGSSDRFVQKVPRLFRKSFFAHLEAQWARYKALEGFEPILPSEIRYLARKPAATSSEEHTMTDDEARAIIEGTDNWTYRTLFEAADGTGGRISEYLHMFRFDLVPSLYSRRFMDFTSPDPLLIFADPVRSLWTGKYAEERRKQVTRATFMRRTYNLEPRLDDPDKSYALGFKGMKFPHADRIRIPVWLNSATARKVEDAALELGSVCKRAGTDRHHPYLFVSTGTRTTLGEPLRIGNVEKAFDRAACKAGLLGKPGIHLHGFRHKYVKHLRTNGLQNAIVQFLIGHANENSNLAYGRDWQAAHDAVKSLEVAHAS